MNPWIKAARLRTLPLAVSGILLGSAVAFLNGSLQTGVLLMGLLTAVLLQILSNYANDYGDFSKGTDALAGRSDRMLASGQIQPGQMKTAMGILILLCLASGLFLLYTGIKSANTGFWIFLGIGLASIAAAIAYTVGKKAYGYSGFGDLFVFIFFGLISVVGIDQLHAASIHSEAWLAAIGFGFLSTAVLNVNNIRDLESDKASGKNTFALRMGYAGALRYHTLLVWGGFILTAASFVLHIKTHAEDVSQMEYMLTAASFSPFLVLFGMHINSVKSTAQNDKPAFNKLLKNLSLSILGFICFYWVLAWMYV